MFISVSGCVIIGCCAFMVETAFTYWSTFRCTIYALKDPTVQKLTWNPLILTQIICNACILRHLYSEAEVLITSSRAEVWACLFMCVRVCFFPEIAASFVKASHFNTFGGNPLACAVASSVLDVRTDLLISIDEFEKFLIKQWGKFITCLFAQWMKIDYMFSFFPCYYAHLCTSGEV